ncbi:unnamed protein product, partial [Gulo gulo]
AIQDRFCSVVLWERNWNFLGNSPIHHTFKLNRAGALRKCLLIC